MATKSSGPGGNRVRIEANPLGILKDEQTPTLVAYAFSRSGRLLGRTDLQDGRADISTPATKEPEAVRVLIGPPIDREDEGEVLSTLIRLGAPERMVRPDQPGDALQFPIDRNTWLCWLRFCIVRGTLLKRVITGGLSVDLPVCGAEVEIYEVDPIRIILPKVPDLVIDRIRDLIRKPGPPPPPEERFPYGVPFPPVPPGPGPDPTQFLGAVNLKTSIAATTAMARGPAIREDMSAMPPDEGGTGDDTAIAAK